MEQNSSSSKTLFINAGLYRKCTLEHLYQLRSLFNATLHRVGAVAPHGDVQLLLGATEINNKHAQFFYSQEAILNYEPAVQNKSYFKFIIN